MSDIFIVSLLHSHCQKDETAEQSLELPTASNRVKYRSQWHNSSMRYSSTTHHVLRTQSTVITPLLGPFFFGDRDFFLEGDPLACFFEPRFFGEPCFDGEISPCFFGDAFLRPRPFRAFRSCRIFFIVNVMHWNKFHGIY